MAGRRVGDGGADRDSDLLKYYPILLAFFRARLSRHLRERAEDLAQETLLAALASRAEELEPIRDITAYLLGIANNKLRNAIRQHRRRNEVSLAGGDGQLSRRVAEVAAETRLVEAERQRALGEALKRLKPEEQELIRLRYNEELGNAEAAERMGITADEASRLKWRALEKLQSELRQQPGGTK